jgi:rhamnogalacturonan acetylesterase
MGTLLRSTWLKSLTLLNIFHFAASARLHLCGDSTMAKGQPPIDGWGQYLQPLMSIPVTNHAVGGRSARSYTVEGRFDAVIKEVKPGDTVVIEFGRNDSGNVKNDTYGQAPCVGSGSETCQTTKNGRPQTVLTYPAYLTNAGKAMTRKGAKVVVSSMLPHNVWWTRPGGKQNLNPPAPRFVAYAKLAAERIGPGATYVDHWTSTVDMWKKLGKAKVDSYFPRAGDPVHTGPNGAKAVAQSFVNALKVAKDPLAQYVK